MPRPIRPALVHTEPVRDAAAIHPDEVLAALHRDLTRQVMHVMGDPAGRNSYSSGARASPGCAHRVVTQSLVYRIQLCAIAGS